MLLRGCLWLFSGLAALLLVGDHTTEPATAAPHAEERARAALRAPVALRLELAAADYRIRLRQDTTRVAAALTTALRPALARFGFLNWEAAPGEAFDTITLRLVQGDQQPRHVRLEVRARGSSVGAPESYSTMFETFGEARTRADWGPDAVVTEWVGRLEEILTSERDGLVERVFGWFPLAARVELFPEDLQAHVAVHPDSIRAAAQPMPRFRLTATVTDTALSIPTEGEAELFLGGCLRHPADGTYACIIDGLQYQDSYGPAADRQALLTRAEIVTRSVHLYEYWPAPSRSGPVGPTGGNRP